MAKKTKSVKAKAPEKKESGSLKKHDFSEGYVILHNRMDHPAEVVYQGGPITIPPRGRTLPLKEVDLGRLPRIVSKIKAA